MLTHGIGKNNTYIFMIYGDDAKLNNITAYGLKYIINTLDYKMKVLEIQNKVKKIASDIVPNIMDEKYNEVVNEIDKLGRKINPGIWVQHIVNTIKKYDADNIKFFAITDNKEYSDIVNMFVYSRIMDLQTVIITIYVNDQTDTVDDELYDYVICADESYSEVLSRILDIFADLRII